MSRLWEKGQPIDAAVLAYTVGEDCRLDERLVAHDVRASIAHAEGLARRGLLAPADLDAIRAGLAALAEEHARGLWRIAPEEEDVHTALENRLVARVGAAGARLHLGRSRNDQVLAALRLYLRDAVGALAEGAEAVAAALGEVAARQGEVALPGYTHTRPAMPSSVALWCGGFAAELADDAEGLRAARRRLSRSPLGSAAGYGAAPLDLDRAGVAAALGFAGAQEPVTAVQLSRGKGEAQVLFELALLANDLSRLAADLVLFSAPEYGFVELPPETTTGSSVMPHKRNPDLWELVRARAAGALARLVEALALPAKLTSGYHRDLQLLKAPLFAGIDDAAATLALVAAVLPRIAFRPDRIRMAPELWAAARAYRLVLDEGIPFREAYRRVAAELARGE